MQGKIRYNGETDGTPRRRGEDQRQHHQRTNGQIQNHWTDQAGGSVWHVDIPPARRGQLPGPEGRGGLRRRDGRAQEAHPQQLQLPGTGARRLEPVLDGVTEVSPHGAPVSSRHSGACSGPGRACKLSDHLIRSSARRSTTSRSRSRRTSRAAGYTYFGQFIDHDLTFDDRPGATLPVEEPDKPGSIENLRTPVFDLDSLYGGGPDKSPKLYDGAKFIIGGGKGDMSLAQFDLPRDGERRARSRTGATTRTSSSRRCTCCGCNSTT